MKTCQDLVLRTLVFLAKHGIGERRGTSLENQSMGKALPARRQELIVMRSQV